MKSSGHGALWILWGLALLLLFGLWWVGLTERTVSALQAREVNVLSRLPDLQESFLGLEQLGLVLANTASQENMNAPLTEQRLSELSSEGEPFYRFFTLTPQAHQAPPWLEELCHRRLTSEIGVVEVIRPLPPGFETPIQGASERAPSQYLAFAARGPRGEILVWQLDWDYVFGAWLQERLKRFSLGDSLTAEFLSPDEVLELGPQAQNPSRRERPTWLLETFLSDQASHFGRLQLQLDNSEAVRSELAAHLRLLLAGAVLMAGFALVLVLTTRALRAKAEYVEAKARFVSMVGHELRTPVTAIEMYLEILREGLVDEPAKIAEYHEILQSESHRLKSLVENLLSLGLNESGGLQLQLNSLELGSLLESVIAKENREERDVVLTVDEPVTLQADSDALYGVFSNLLHNALNYSPPESKVEVQMTRSSNGVLVQVFDRGPGLPEAEYARLFEPYYRSGETPNKRSGLGLGLPLAQQLVLAHKGSIRGEARLGGGSVFSVQLRVEDHER